MKKNFLITVLFLLCSVSLCGQGLTAHGNFILRGTTLVDYRGFEKEVVIPDNLGITEVANDAFHNQGITSITFPEGILKIGKSFLYCFRLTEIYLPASLTEIADGAFDDCTSLTNIFIDENNQTYSSDNGVLFNKDKTILVRYLFAKQGSEYSVPEGVKQIWNGAFYYCRGLRKITLPSSLTIIGNDAFQFCYYLGIINIPDGVTSIGRRAFQNCERLYDIKIPASVNSIGFRAFSGCVMIVNFSVDEKNREYVSVEGVLFNKEKTVLIQYPVRKADDFYMIPFGVREISAGAFSNSRMSLIRMPPTVTVIGEFAFSECRNITSMSIPPTVIDIGMYAFNMCRGLTSISIPPSVTSIGRSAFSECRGLINIILHEGLLSIGEMAFSWCTSLSSIVIPKSVIIIGDYAFTYCSDLITVSISRKTIRGRNVFPAGAMIIESAVP
ncbi:MAG: leucine-rich repeat domain-containing protein [Treponema sp.]|nr:leucine-rich repeat domain-containing protein [Treponema sp.]